MSDGTTSEDFDWSQVPDEMPNETARDARGSEFDWSKAPNEMPNETARNDAYNRYLDVAGSSGVDSPLVQKLKSAWGDANGFVKNNPDLTSLFTASLGNAQRQKYSAEQLAKLNQYKIDAEDRSTARDKAIYDRRNQSIIDTNTADMGIIGLGALDSHLAYMTGRN